MNEWDNQYTRFNLFLGSNKIDLFNHGYYPSFDYIDNEDILFKNQISLYLKMFEDIDITDKSILDVGCGRGGGISAVAKYLNAKEISACDLNKLNIDYCKTNQNKNISFKQCDAQYLDYPDKSFDIVLSIESSHLYEKPSLFFNNVHRVLKDNGIFLYADCGENIQKFYHHFHLFKRIIREDITENVKNSCKEDIDRFETLIEDNDIKNTLKGISSHYYKKYSVANNQYIRYTVYK